MPRSSRGLGHRPFTAATGVRIPVGSFVGSDAKILVTGYTFKV